MKLKEDEIVLCTVKKIEGTTVFLTIEGNGEGSMTFSEVSPGRIRNIREFVTEGKKIVCRILRIKGDNVELSLRRVTTKERELLLEENKKEKSFRAVLEQIVKNKANEIIEKIKEEHKISEFINEIKNNPKILEKFLNKKEIEKLSKILAEKQEKEKEVKKIIVVKSLSSSGLNDIKKVLDIDKAKISYLGSSKFLIRVNESNFKAANIKMSAIINEIEEKAKKLKVHFEIK